MTQYARFDASGNVLATYTDPAPEDITGMSLVALAAGEEPRPLAQLKADHWGTIKAEREARILSAGATPFGTFDTAPSSVVNITSVATLLLANPLLPTVAFTLADDTRPTFTRADFLAGATVVGAAVQALYDTAHALRVQIDAAATVEAVLALTWPP